MVIDNAWNTAGEIIVNHLIPIYSKTTGSLPQKNQDTSDYLLDRQYFPVYLCTPAIELLFHGGRYEASNENRIDEIGSYLNRPLLHDEYCIALWRSYAV